MSQGRPLLWRATRQIAASLIATIFAQPTLKKLRQTLGAVKYRLHFWKEEGTPPPDVKGNLLRDGASFETGYSYRASDTIKLAGFYRRDSHTEWQDIYKS